MKRRAAFFLAIFCTASVAFGETYGQVTRYCHKAFAGSTEWTVGSNGNKLWADDGVPAYALLQEEESSGGIECTQFGFVATDFPAGTIILGIEVRAEVYTEEDPEGVITNAMVTLRDNTGLIGNTRYSSMPLYNHVWTEIPTDLPFGYAIDMWNVWNPPWANNGLALAAIKTGGFGCLISVESTLDNTETHVYMDYVKIVVHFQAP